MGLLYSWMNEEYSAHTNGAVFKLTLVEIHSELHGRKNFITVYKTGSSI
jgi:hypothetical protein